MDISQLHVVHSYNTEKPTAKMLREKKLKARIDRDTLQRKLYEKVMTTLSVLKKNDDITQMRQPYHPVLYIIYSNYIGLL